MASVLEKLTQELAGSADGYDRSKQWPEDVVRVLGAHGCWRWGIPRAYGGDEHESVRLIEGLEAIARGSLTAVLIFTQHDAGESPRDQGNRVSPTQFLLAHVERQA